MLLAGALGVLLTLSVLRAADHSEPVLVAAKDLVPGTVISDADLRVARVHSDASVIATLFGAAALADLRGQVVTTTIHAGALVTRGDVRAVGAQAARRVMSFPLPRARAVGGKLVAGDRVDVIAVERNTARSGYVLTDAEVIAVDTHESGPLAGGSDDVTVTLAVDPATAPRLAAALDAGTVTLVRATGAAPLRHPPVFSPSGASQP
jgi:Flp pilus assembly protein CpaB